MQIFPERYRRKVFLKQVKLLFETAEKKYTHTAVMLSFLLKKMHETKIFLQCR